MSKEAPKTDLVTFITEKNNWLDAGRVKEVKLNKSKDVAQIHFEDGQVAEIHSCNPLGSGRGALVVSDLVSSTNVEADRTPSEGEDSQQDDGSSQNDSPNSVRDGGSSPASCSAGWVARWRRNLRAIGLWIFDTHTELHLSPVQKVSESKKQALIDFVRSRSKILDKYDSSFLQDKQKTRIVLSPIRKVPVIPLYKMEISHLWIRIRGIFSSSKPNVKGESQASEARLKN